MPRRLEVFVLVLALFGGCQPSPALACQYDPQIIREAARQGVEPWVAVAIVHAESSGNPGAVGPGGERGLFQLTKPVWRVRFPGQVKADWGFNPQMNIEAGVWNLARSGARNAKETVSWHNAGRKDYRNLNPKWVRDHPNRIYRSIYRGEMTQ